jgi:hypothetical protein
VETEKEKIKMSNLYSEKYVEVVRDFLKVRCSNARRVSREAIVEQLAKFEMCVSVDRIALDVKEGVFNLLDKEWTLFAGRYGGIREVELDGRTVAARLRKLNKQQAPSESQVAA